MKKQNYLLLLGLMLSCGLLITACAKDDDPVVTPPVDLCADVTCENGGTCDDGTCDCPPGFSGTNCEIEDPCHAANENNEWGYDDFGGPGCWNAVCSDHTCLGDAQSPINIIIADTVLNNALPNLSIFSKNTTTEIVNNGHTIQFNQQAGTFINYGSGLPNGQLNDLTLGQFHFHAKSEHQVDGGHAALEAHFVCRSIWANNYIVISVLFEEGASNATLENFVSHLPAGKDDTYSDNDLIYKAFDLLPENKSYYKYSGSLTTPPCSEIVTWIVMKNKVEASADQIAAFKTIMGDNYRPVQDLNGRTVEFREL